MRILSFEYRDWAGWTLEPLKLDAFNLLVGLSGAGKTRIVQAIEQVCNVALGTKKDAWPVPGTRFAMDFEHNGLTYRWAAQFEDRLQADGDVVLAPLQTERIEQAGRPLVDRTPDRFIFAGQQIPRLDRGQSAIAILHEDPTMAALHQAFSRCVFQVLNTMPAYGTRDAAAFEKLRQQYSAVEALGADFSQPLHNKAELLNELFPAAFTEITAAFREAFPLVERLWVRRLLLSEKTEYVALTAQESGVEHPFPFGNMSSGMQRYLSFLVHLSFAPPGTVVLIDELESSFGINCLPAAVDFLLSRAPDLQLILTSHHPYIIQKIPTDLWKIVTRKGSHVRVLDAAAIPDLEESRSHLDRYTRLVNQPEYANGIQS